MHHSRNVAGSVTDLEANDSAASSIRNRNTSRAAGSTRAIFRNPMIRGLALALVILPGAIWAGFGPGPGQYTVTSPADTGADTLRQAIIEVNAGSNCAGAPCTNIVFAPSMNGSTIFLNTSLPPITASNVFIDGYSAAPGQINTGTFGAALNNQPPIIVATTSGGLNGFDASAPNIRIRGFQIRQFNNGITLNSTGASIEGNWIGTDTAGTGALANNIGILVLGSSNTIGGTSDDKRNLISGNSTGIQVNVGGNTIATNYIGTDKTGTLSLRNSFFGIDVGAAANGNAIGTSGKGNVISGNGTGFADGGLRIASDNNTVLNNRVGTSASGLSALGNTGNGIQLTGLATNNDIGTISGSGNLVSGNTASGILVSGVSNRFRFNSIGSDLTGTGPIPNVDHGILVNANSNTITNNLIAGNSREGIFISGITSGNIVQQNTIGTAAFGNQDNGINLGFNVTNTLISNNDIGFNGIDGVVATGSGGSNFANEILGNQIHDNLGLGIDLESPSGPNANDAGDGDTTPGNRGQNTPVLASPFNNGSTTTVKVSVDSSAVVTTASIRVQIFQADAAAQEGQTFLGEQCFAGNNVVSQPITVSGAAVGSNLVGSATSYTSAGCVTANDGTSEFSAAAAVVACPTINVSPATVPSPVTRGTAYPATTISTTDGTSPYTFSVVAGSLPPGLTLNSSSGLLSGTPTATGTFPFTIRITDSNGCFGDRAYSITVTCPVITIAPATLPGGTQGTPYSQTLTASGGNTPHTFAVTAGSLPPGLTLTSAGLLSGTPTTPGSFPFTVTATEASGGCTGSQSYTVVISCPTITVAPAPPSGTTGTAYSHTFTPSGGTAPYTFSISSGTLPPGLTMSSAGVISGTPTTAGTSSFTVSVTDANSCPGSAGFTITISCPVITVGGTPPAGTVGTPYSAALSASGGTAPYTFALSSGSLPPGLTLSSTGTISGTPTTPGSFPFSVNATDANGCVGSGSFTIVISCPATTISPASLPGGSVGTPYNQTLTASGAPGPYTFSISTGSLPPGLTLSPTGTIAGTPTTTGSFSFTVMATTSAGCSGSQSYTINVSLISADLSITKSDGQSTADAGSPITYLIKASNSGPNSVTGATVTDTFPAQVTGVSWTCSATPGSSCPASGSGNINAPVNLLAGGSVTFIATGTIPSTSTGTITNTAFVNPPGTVSDPNAANNSASDSTQISVPQPPCPTIPVITSPTAGSTTVPPSGTIEFSTSNSDMNIVYLGPAGQGCLTEFGRTSGNSIAYSGLTPGRTYEARVESTRAGCSTLQSACIRFTIAAGCGTAVPRLISPKPNDRVTSPTRFEWEAVPGNPEYGLFVGENGQTPTLRVRTRETSATVDNLSPGRIVAFVEAYLPNCPPARSPEVGFEGVCGAGPIPEPAAVGKVTTGEDYEVTWPVQASRYQLEEATNSQFNGATVFNIDVVPGSSVVRVPFRKQVTALTFFYYRVRALNGCSNQFGPFSYILRVAIEVPVVPNATEPRADVDVTTEFGSTEKIIQTVFLPGSNAGSPDTSFTATSEDRWITVSPSSGSIPPAGVILTITIDPAGLPVGTNTGTVIIITNSPVSKFVTNATTRRNLPTSVNLVTPVTPKGKNIPPPNALIIPAVGHTDGINSKWLSDIRVTNTSGQPIKYQMTFTPSGIDGTQTGKQTEVTIPAGVTTAMDDIVNNWYGLGQGAENINGALEIRPLNFSGKTVLDVVSAATVASSRTYNSTPTGTLGQFVPGVPFSSFIGKLNSQGSAAVINMQQITQNAAFRTNMGIVEGSGEPATVLISAFNTSGQKLTEFSQTLKAAEHVQLNGVLSSRNITVNDGRIEVRVTSDTGRVTAFASVIDNATGDPILVPAVQTDGLSVTKLVIPGVADIDTGVNRWKTDMRLFNAGIASANPTLVFYPQDDPAAAKSIQVTVPPGQILVLDNLLQSRFGVTNIGGAIHVNTGNASALVATARTYDQRPNGTLSLFVPAVKPEEAAGIGDRALQVQQLEQSDRFRTHLGIAEVTGNKVTVEISAILPNTTATPKFQLDLDGNEFTQITQILSRLNIGTAYNARVTVKVIAGTGKVTAYGSVIDNTTHDPTYIPAQ